MCPGQESTFGGGKRLILLEVFDGAKKGADVEEEFVRHDSVKFCSVFQAEKYRSNFTL
jgi:hypothetical protein